MSLKIIATLPDSSTREFDKGLSIYEMTGEIGKGLQNAALAAEVDGKPVDLSFIPEKDFNLKVYTFDSPQGKEVLWHSASHLMAQAVKRLYKDAKLAIGPPIDSGFYYDVDTETTLTPQDLEKIEAEMAKIVQESFEVSREEIPRLDAIEMFKKSEDIYKVELLEGFSDDTVTFYRQGEFFDLCRGPHVMNTSRIKSFKLLSTAGAYWRGDEKNKMLQRIYGVAFPEAKLLKKHLAFLEEVKKRDHRKIGKELDLFSTHDDAGSGLIYWHPKGGRLRTLLEEWWRDEHFKNGYEILYSPHIGKASLWETSGHLGFYSDNMYSPMEIDGSDYYVKPMNCPFHIKVYQSNLYSYRDLPLRWAELGTVYRYEKSGVLHGLLRVRGFTQDDAHIFCTPEQIEDEIIEVIRFSLWMWKVLGFSEIKAYLATKPEKSVGEQERWDTAQASLQRALERENVEMEVDEGGGAFYGPKIDLKVRDALGREWQMTTIQFDFNLPERFDMYYIGEDGQKHRPYMVHRALLGSIERFIGILIEHYGGKFPLWLSPVQAIIISVSGEQVDAVQELRQKMIQRGYRPSVDVRNESVGYKIRDAVTQKVPYVIVMGKNEVEAGTLSVRKRGEKNSISMTIEDFFAEMDGKVAEKS